MGKVSAYNRSFRHDSGGFVAILGGDEAAWAGAMLHAVGSSGLDPAAIERFGSNVAVASLMGVQ
jgi:hypothetical protein